MKVSICIPTYNQSQYLIQAVESSFNQTLKPVEIIVSNDCSSDDTKIVLEKLSRQIPILKIINQPVNLGIAKNTDACLRASTGDYVVRLDSDDYLSPEYVEKLATLLDANNEAGYAHAAVQAVDQQSQPLNERRLARKSGAVTSEEALRASNKGYRVAANIIMFRRSALIKVNYITGRPDYVEDYHLSASLAASGYSNIYLDEILSFYRVWVDTGKVRQRRKLMEITGLHRVFTEVLEPAYKKRNWNLKILHKRRARFASRQADCLSWDVYSSTEKAELKNALLTLSNSTTVKLNCWVYLNGLGGIIEIYSKITSFPKKVVKNLLFSLKSVPTPR